MSAEPATPFLARIRQQLPDFPPMERRLAEFVLDFPGDLASYAANELAVLSGVSNATVSRFIKRLGYRHFDDARRQVRDERNTGSPLFRTRRDAGLAPQFSAHLQRHQHNLHHTLARLNPAEINRMARALLGARTVWVAGFRSSQSFASYFRWQMFQVKERVLLVPQAGDTLGQTVASMQRRDVVVVFALRRRPAVLQAFLGQVVASGARVIHVSDERTARMAGLTWHVHCSCESERPLDDHVAVAALCHLLASRVLELAGPRERARLTAIEASYAALQEL